MSAINMSPQGGRMYKENGDYISLGDLLDKTPKAVTFHNSQNAMSNGVEYTVGPGDNSITLEIIGTATSFTVNFEGMGPSGTYYSVMGSNLSSPAIATQASVLNQLWEVSINALAKFRVRISSISGGYITVMGQVNR